MTTSDPTASSFARMLDELRISPSMKEIVEEEGRYHTALQINESFASRPDGLKPGRDKPDFRSQLTTQPKGSDDGQS